MILNISTLPADLFSFKDNKFVSCFSDFGKAFELKRVYHDACDVGFSILSPKTGKCATFALQQDHYDREGDYTHSEFVCITPGLKNLTAVVFND